MPRNPDMFTTIIFCIFLTLPLSTLSLWGYSSWAQRPPTWQTLDIVKFSSDRNYRKSTLKEVIINSPAGIEALSVKSSVDINVFNFVDTDLVLSGRDGWLFYKQDFSPRVSISDIDSMINKMKSLAAVAKGVGIGLLFTVTPDKTIAYADMLGKNGNLLAKCKFQFASDWRERAKKLDLKIVDHLDALIPYLQDNKRNYYYKTDTHWNDSGVDIAMNQLARHFEIEVPPVPDNAPTSQIWTDLMRMLRYPAFESGPDLNAFWNSTFRDAVNEKLENVTVIHDSFYARASRALGVLFPDYLDVRLGSEPSGHSWLRPTVIVNTVERHLLARVRHGPLSWQGNLGRGLISRSADAAESCVWQEAGFSINNGSQKEIRNIEAFNDDLQIITVLPDRPQPCVRFTFGTASKTPSQIFLPTDSNAFAVDFGIDFFVKQTKKRQFAMILPGEFRNRPIRFDPFTDRSTATDLIVEVGEIPTSRPND